MEDFSSQPVSAASLRGLISGIVLSTGKGLIVALDKLKENLEYLDISHAGTYSYFIFFSFYLLMKGFGKNSGYD